MGYCIKYHYSNAPNLFIEMKSQRSKECYLLIDHRSTIGPDGMPGALQEIPLYVCSHCQAQVVVNPLRTRDRAYCPKCDHVICDKCEAARVASGGNCRTFNQLIEEIQETEALKQQRIMI